MHSFTHIAASAVLGLAAIFVGLNHGVLRNLREAFVSEMFRRARGPLTPLPPWVSWQTGGARRLYWFFGQLLVACGVALILFSVFAWLQD